MKKLYLPLFFIFIALNGFVADDPFSKVADSIRQGNINQLTAMMAESVEIAVPGNESTFSKTQAAVVLNNFFSQNKPVSVKVLHKVNSNAHYQLGVLLVDTSSGLYRVALTLKEIKGTLQLIEFRVEPAKVK